MKNETYKSRFSKKGQAGIGGALVGVVLVVVIIVALMVFGGVFTGQLYQTTESSIASITNTTIKGHITEGIASSFEGFSTAGGYVPLIVTFSLMILFIGGIVGLTRFTQGGNGGSVL